MRNYRINPKICAGYLPRLVAFALDSFIVWAIKMLVVLYIPMMPMHISQTKIFFTFNVLDIMGYMLFVLYFVLSVQIFGTTLGKSLFNMKIVSLHSKQLSFTDVIYRETVGRFLNSILGIGYILMAFDREKRTIADRLCDTRVIYENVYTSPSRAI